MAFDDQYRPDGVAAFQDVARLAHLEAGAAGLGRFLSAHAGRSFEHGLYRIHPVADMDKWTSIIAEAFPNFTQRMFCFSYDWLGRHFALDLRRRAREQYLVLMFEPSTGQALEIPANFCDFHNQELVEFRNQALASDFYESWLSSGGVAPSRSECIGYKKPLFLGGEDVVANLEVIDMEVYWSISGQLLAKTRHLPEGTRLSDIRISD